MLLHYLEDVLHILYCSTCVATVYETESVNDNACVRDEMLYFFFVLDVLVDFFWFPVQNAVGGSTMLIARIAILRILRANCQVGPRASARRDRAEGRKVWRM